MPTREASGPIGIYPAFQVEKVLARIGPDTGALNLDISCAVLLTLRFVRSRGPLGGLIADLFFDSLPPTRDLVEVLVTR